MPRHKYVHCLLIMLFLSNVYDNNHLPSSRASKNNEEVYY